MGGASSSEPRRVRNRAGKRDRQQHRQEQQPPGKRRQPQQPRECVGYCCEQLTPTDETRLSCGFHSMHAGCLATWTQACNRGGTAVTCPICRSFVGPEPPPQQRRAALEWRAQANQQAMRASPQAAALMRLTRRVGETQDASPGDQAALLRVLRALPPELVIDLALNRGPDDVVGAVRDALERALASSRLSELVRPGVAAVLADERLMMLLSSSVVLPREGEAQDPDYDQDNVNGDEADALADAEEAADYRELGGRVLGLSDLVYATWERLWGAQNGPADPARRDLLAELVDRLINPPDAAFQVWALLARNHGISALAGLDGAQAWAIGEALLRGDDVAHVLSTLPGAPLSDEQTAFMLRGALGAREFVDAVLWSADYDSQRSRADYEVLAARLGEWEAARPRSRTSHGTEIMRFIWPGGHALSVSAQRLLTGLVDRDLPPVQAALSILTAVAHSMHLGQMVPKAGTPEGRRLGSAILEREDLRDALRAMASSEDVRWADISGASYPHLRRVACHIADFIEAVGPMAAGPPPQPGSVLRPLRAWESQANRLITREVGRTIDMMRTRMGALAQNAAGISRLLRSPERMAVVVLMLRTAQWPLAGDDHALLLQVRARIPGIMTEAATELGAAIMRGQSGVVAALAALAGPGGEGGGRVERIARAILPRPEVVREVWRVLSVRTDTEEAEAVVPERETAAVDEMLRPIDGTDDFAGTDSTRASSALEALRLPPLPRMAELVAAVSDVNLLAFCVLSARMRRSIRHLSVASHTVMASIIWRLPRAPSERLELGAAVMRGDGLRALALSHEERPIVGNLCPEPADVLELRRVLHARMMRLHGVLNARPAGAGPAGEGVGRQAAAAVAAPAQDDDSDSDSDSGSTTTSNQDSTMTIVARRDRNELLMRMSGTTAGPPTGHGAEVLRSMWGFSPANRPDAETADLIAQLFAGDLSPPDAAFRVWWTIARHLGSGQLLRPHDGSSLAQERRLGAALMRREDMHEALAELGARRVALGGVVDPAAVDQLLRVAGHVAEFVDAVTLRSTPSSPQTSAPSER